MKRLLLLLTLIAAPLLAFAEDKERFPGFQLFEGTDSGDSYYLDSRTARQAGEWLLIPVLVLKVDDSYGLFEVKSDCTQFNILPGTLYSEDNKPLRDFPKATEIDDDMVKRLVRRKCEAPAGTKGFSGEFDPAKALKALLGNFFPKGNFSVLAAGYDKRFPDGAVAQSLFIHPLNSSRTFFLYKITEVDADSKGKDAIETASCHACSVSLGAALFAKDDAAGWRPIFHNPSVGEAGQYGEVEPPIWSRWGKTCEGFIIKSADMHQGFSYETQTFFRVDDTGVTPVLDLTTAASNEGASATECKAPGEGCYDYSSIVEPLDSDYPGCSRLRMITKGTFLSAAPEPVRFQIDKRFAWTGSAFSVAEVKPSLEAVPEFSQDQRESYESDGTMKYLVDYAKERMSSSSAASLVSLHTFVDTQPVSLISTAPAQAAPVSSETSSSAPSVEQAPSAQTSSQREEVPPPPSRLNEASKALSGVYEVIAETTVLDRPSMVASPRGKLTRGAKIQVIGREGRWLQISSRKGAVGFIASQDAMPVNTPPFVDSAP